MIKILIVEDERYAQEELIRLLKMAGEDFQVVDRLESVEDAVEFLSDAPEIDLIFMDIQLADGKSFEIFKQVEVKVPTIFTTAFDDYAIQAFKVNSIDYLLKPIGLEYLKAALEKFRRVQASQTPALDAQQLTQILSATQQGGGYKKRFVATLGDRILQIPVEDIAYFYAEGDTVFVMTEQSKKFIINYSLEQLAHLLEPTQFFRITRKYIAKVSAIKEINKYFNSRLLLNLHPPTSDEVLVSRAKVAEFLKWIDG